MRKVIANARQYETAIAEFARLHSNDNPANTSRLQELTRDIDDFERRTWPEGVFAGLGDVRLAV